MSSAHHPLWALLNSGSDVDDDNDNNIDKSPDKTPLLPPPPPPKREAAESSDHEIHIWTERERRKKMRTMFSNLHALLPHLPAKADKSTIVDEAVNYIKALQESVKKLQKQKLEKLQNRKNNPYPGGLKCNNKVVDDHHPSGQSSTREAFLADQSSSSNDMSSALLTHASTAAATAFHTWTSSNLVLSVCGGDAHFCLCSAKKPGLFAAVCYVLDKHHIDVVSAHVSSDFHRTFFMIQAHVNGGCDEFGAAMVAEEIFKQAAGEIIFWLSS